MKIISKGLIYKMDKAICILWNKKTKSMYVYLSKQSNENLYIKIAKVLR